MVVDSHSYLPVIKNASSILFKNRVGLVIITGIMMKTLKKTVRPLTLAFALVMGPALPSATVPDVQAHHPGSHSPVGLWQAPDQNIIADVTTCPSNPILICATVYKTDTRDMTTSLRETQERAAQGLPPEKKAGNFCSLFEKTSAHEAAFDVWEGDKITRLFASATLNVRMIDNDHAQALARLRLFGAELSKINIAAHRILPDGPEFGACRRMLKKRQMSPGDRSSSY